MSSPLVDTLNDAQREAVIAGDGPILILAGAGSGKTRVITHRIAHLIRDQGVPPPAVVAVTFTNKAAGEMRERIARLLDVDHLPSWHPAAPRLGTFHGFCLRLLREEADRLGFPPTFAVYDADDSKAVLKRVIKDLELDTSTWVPGRVLSRLGRFKDRMVDPRGALEASADHESETLARIYQRYQLHLKQADAMDFDDLIHKTLVLFRDHPDRQEHHARQCRHLLVDEFQDTSASQYRLVRALGSAHGNVIVVGDEDQSIYRFRGADITNILEFQKDHPQARVIRLERNYRSTQVILDAASAVVANNRERLGKTLYTEAAGGEPIQAFRAGSERDEARWVINRIRGLRDEDVAPITDHAILYRTNFQSRPFEDALTQAGVPYMIVGSVRFYERREVKDVLSYLRLMNNVSDDVAALRVLNIPPRGIGPGTIEKLLSVARSEGVAVLTAVRLAVENRLLSPRQHASISRFLDLLDELAEGRTGQPMRRMMEDVINRTGYLAYLERVEPVSFDSRVDNLESLATAADEVEAEGGDLGAFLDRTALTSAVDSTDGEGGVTLMTLHCAKGLEFPSVFLVGMEERLFPHSRSLESRSDIEEERRLFYVGITRAMRQLTLSHAAMRSVYGRLQLAEPSRFLAEVPPELVREEVSDLTSYAALRRGAERDGGSWQSPARRPAASGDRMPVGAVVSRGAGRDGEVTVEYDVAEVETLEELRVGMKVQHGKYGQGTILGTEGGGARLKLTISFPGFGRKKLMARFAGLRVL
ncbi:MAG: ATP-dependent helicase [Acidobacteriota bacterium]